MAQSQPRAHSSSRRKRSLSPRLAQTIKKNYKNDERVHDALALKFILSLCQSASSLINELSDASSLYGVVPCTK